MVDPASCWNLEEANYASWGTSHTDNDGAGSGSPFFVAKYAERNVSLLITQIVALLESRPVCRQTSPNKIEKQVERENKGNPETNGIQRH